MTWDEAFQNAGKIAAILGTVATIWLVWGTDFGFMALTAICFFVGVIVIIAFIAMMLKVIVWLIGAKDAK